MKLTWKNFKENWLYWVTRPINMFFFENKGGVPQFSTKKFWAFFFCALAVANHWGLHFSPGEHPTVVYATQMAKAIGKDNAKTIIVTMIASLDSFALGALAVYGWSKAKGAA